MGSYFTVTFLVQPAEKSFNPLFGNSMSIGRVADARIFLKTEIGINRKKSHEVALFSKTQYWIGLEISSGVFKICILDPNITIIHIVSFRLQF